MLSSLRRQRNLRARKKSRSKRKKLLFVVNDPAFFVSHRLILGQAAQQAGFDVYVAAPWGEGIEVISSHGFRFVPVRIERWGMNPLKELKSLHSLFALYRRIQPDIVHHVTIKPVLYGSLAASLAGVPAVVNAVSGFGYMFLHRTLRGSVRRIFAELLYRFASRHPNGATIFQNSDDQKYFRKKILRSTAKSILIRGSGVDLEHFCAQPLPSTHRPTVMLIGRVLWDKGIGEFVRAARLLRSWGADARFVVVGPAVPNNPSGISYQQIERWVSEGIVEFWGKKSDILPCLQQADIVCLPSYREGLPKVLLEAAACGKPLVATDVPGCREVVRDGYNGILVPSRSAQGLAEGLVTLVSDAELRCEMGAKSRLLMEGNEFSDEHVAHKTLELYYSLIGRKPEQTKIITLDLDSTSSVVRSNHTGTDARG